MPVRSGAAGVAGSIVVIDQPLRLVIAIRRPPTFRPTTDRTTPP
jgi:hypothetical protein